MKHFLIVSFVLGFRLLFAQDYIQKDSALTMGTVVVIDDQSLYFKKFKRDRYVRLGVNEVVEYRQNGKVFRAFNFQGNRRFYRN